MRMRLVIIVNRSESFCWRQRLARRYAIRGALQPCLLVQDVKDRGAGAGMRKSERFIAVVVPFAFCRGTVDIVANIGHDWMRNQLCFGLPGALQQLMLLQL